MQKLGTKPGNSKMVGIRLTEKQLNHIKKQKISISEYVRSLIDKDISG